MKMRFNKHLINQLFCLTLLFFFTLVASVHGEQKSRIKIKFGSFFELEANTLFSIGILKESQDGEKKIEKSGKSFLIEDSGFTQPINAPGRDCVLTLPAKTPGGLPEIIATLKLPAPGNKFIVLLAPDAKGVTTARVMDAEDSSFRDGDVILFNFYHDNVYGLLADEKVILKPEKSHIYRPKKRQNTGTYGAKFFTKKGKKLRAFRSAAWPYNLGRRTFVFFYKKRNKPAMRAIDEYTDWITSSGEDGLNR